MTRVISSLVVGVACLASALAGQGRDAPAPTRGTATVAGVVLDDHAPPQAVRRAIVTLSGPGLTPSRSAITDDAGRFRMSNLPAGRFTLVATRASFVTSAYGAKRPGRPGTSIAIADGALVDGLTVRLWRGAAVGGVVRDETGAPVAGIPVTALRARDVSAGMMTLSNNGVVSNELGEYRIFGLEPGTYVIFARPSTGSGGPLTAMTEAQVDAAINTLRSRVPTATPASSTAPASTEVLRPFTYAPVYHPGTAVLDQATQITVKPGDERLAIDISLQRVTTAIVQGTVSQPDGSPATGTTVQLSSVRQSDAFSSGPPSVLRGTTDARGGFRVAQVPPGDYRLVARVPLPASPAQPGVVMPPAPGRPSQWATMDLSVSGSDINGIALTVGPGVTISGRLAFASSSTSTPAAPAPAVGGLQLALLAPWVRDLKPNTPLDSIGSFVGTTVQPDGTFRFTGMLPSTYVLSISPGTAYPPAPWSVRSAMIGDRDLLDAPIALTPEMGAAPLVITFADQRTDLSGTLQTSSGAAVSDVFVLAFSTDRRLWVPRSRRVQAVRPGMDGRFVFADLPAGEYLLGAVTDVVEGEWFDPGFLDALVPAALKVTIAEGEKKVQNLRIGG